MSANEQLKVKVKNAFIERGINPSDEMVEEAIQKGGTTKAVKDVIGFQTPKTENKTESVEEDISQGSIQAFEVLDKISSKNAFEIQDAIGAMTWKKVAYLSATGHEGGNTQEAKKECLDFLLGSTKKVSESMPNFSISSGQIELPKQTFHVLPPS